VTKRKTGVFRGAWVDGTVPVTQLRERINAEPGSIDADPVISAVSEQRAAWKFDKQRRDTEPEPAQWSELLASLDVPAATTDHKALTRLKRDIDHLPLRVLAELDGYIFRSCSLGWRGLIARILDTGDPADLELIRGALAALSDTLPRVRGKRGPKWDAGPALRVITEAILKHSNLRPVPARVLAAELLNMCGIRVPSGRAQLAKLSRE
jgi:hypothetical protein